MESENSVVIFMSSTIPVPVKESKSFKIMCPSDVRPI